VVGTKRDDGRRAPLAATEFFDYFRGWRTVTMVFNKVKSPKEESSQWYAYGSKALNATHVK
jgi:hypothetical protein